MDSTRCWSCQKDVSAWENSTGSLLFPGIKCPHCGAMSLYGEVGKHFEAMINSSEIQGIRVNENGEGIKAYTRRGGTTSEQVDELNVLEYWVQLYVKANYRKLGFSKMDGPFDRGPDFQVVYQGTETLAEVEVRCENYVQHGHPKDPRFNPDVGILIVLEPSDPSDEIKNQLPEKIIHLNTEDFKKWYAKATQEYAIQKETEQPTRKAEAKLRVLAWEFQRRYYAACPLMEEETGQEDDMNLWEFVALRFLAERKTVDLNLNEIEMTELEQFASRVIAAGGPEGFLSTVG